MSEITNLADQINNMDLCADINTALAPAMAAIQEKIDSINASLADILPLTQIPHDLGGCISWITKMVNKFTGPQSELIAELTQTVEDIGTLAAAVQNAAGKIEGCSITMPSLSGLPTP